MQTISNCKNCKKKCKVKKHYWKNCEKQEKADICILCFSSSNTNYGANLVCYAMSELIKKLGYSVNILNFDIEEDRDIKTKFLGEAFINFRKKYLSLTPKKKYGFQFLLLNYYYKVFISGSDQVFNTFNTKPYSKHYFLDFVKDCRLKIAFSASFGMEQFIGDEKLIYEVKKLLQRFNYISIREGSAVDVLKKTFDSDYGAQITIDPTLIVGEETFAPLLKDKSICFEEKYIAYYLLSKAYNIKQKETDYILNKIKNVYNLPLINIHSYPVDLPCGKVNKFYEVSDWLNYIKNAEFVITDSFHGVCFSIIFRKNFIYIEGVGSTRVKYLLEILGLSNLICKSFDDVHINQIDYDKVEEKLSTLKEKSVDFLKTAVNSYLK